MEENLIKCLKTFAGLLISTEFDSVSGYNFVEEFCKQAELALSESAKEELAQYLDSCFF